MTTSFKNFVPKLFESDEQKEARALAKIEQARNAREAARGVALRYAALTDALATAKESFVKQSAVIDAACKSPSVAEYASAFLSGVPLKIIGEDAAARAALKTQAEAIKAELQKLIAGVAEKSLATFTADNKKIIAKLPPLERASEPEFVPAASAAEWSDMVSPAPPSPAVRAMLGLKPGETLPPGYEPKTNGQMINNLDED